ncbi:chorion class A protein Ld5-like [Epargyreus clarus]|uniref:chorion class A protein Ld5-like n=1 Tax=Epargyreus clarus TaxID=520877 RepID=UPI003C2B0999
MLFLAFLFVCIQACLVQDVSSQCIGSYGAGLAPAASLAPLASPCGTALSMFAAPFATSPFIPFTEPFLVETAAGPFGAYGGAGYGEIAVAGELPVGGTTLVAGQVPILGAVEFGGIVPAGGAVTIAGSCACGCAGPYVY